MKTEEWLLRCKHVENFIWVSSKHLERRSEHASDCLQILPFQLTMSEEQEENCINTCQDLQGWLGRDPEFFLKIITRDMGLWVRHRNQEIVVLMEEPVISTPEKGKTSLHRREECAFFFFCDIQGVVHYEFVPQEQILTQHNYIDTLHCLWEYLWQN
jgi:hypothetical protein